MATRSIPAFAVTSALSLVAGCFGSESKDDRRDTDADADTDGDADCVGRGESPTAGGPCGCSDDCDPGETCASEATSGSPGGICMAHCSVDDDCPDGFVCWELTPGDSDTRMCLQGCESTEDCRTGYVCQRLAEGSEPPLLCAGLCQADSDCDNGQCDLYQGSCGSQGHTGSGVTGDACDSGRDCRSGQCGTGFGFPGGYCSSLCSVSRQGCPGSGLCLPLGESDDDLGSCFKACERDSDCRMDEGYVCGTLSEDPPVRVCATAGG